MLDYFLKLKKKLWNRASGQFSSLLRGSGIDLADNRVYSPGDDTRRINRKMSAKYDKTFINLFHDEKAIDVSLCCDVNYNWRSNEKEFLHFFAELTTYFQSKKGHITWYMWTHTFPSLEKIGYQKTFLEACNKKTASSLPVYHSSLQALLASQLSIPKQRLIIVVSDFLAYGTEEERLVNMLRQKHEVLLITISVSTSVDIISLSSIVA